ncbi:hypothetical protein [uncultured Prevotella sp.]|nr:hypothetical protein [uncultured Prevotella sp.]
MQGLFSRFPYSTGKACRCPVSHVKTTTARAENVKTATGEC